MWDKQKEVFLPSTPGLGMHVEVKDPDGKVNTPTPESSSGCQKSINVIMGCKVPVALVLRKNL